MSNKASVAAIQFALDSDREDGCGMDFLRVWNEGDFDAIRKEWPEAPEEVFIGADPLHPKTRSMMCDESSISYEMGSWFEAHSLDEMQKFYMARLPAIREAARELGYAIGLHGSTRRDLDLMAMQWRDDAADKNTLARAIQHAACGISNKGDYMWEKKPLGRTATSFTICWTDHKNPEFKNKLSLGHVDLSVIGV